MSIIRDRIVPTVYPALWALAGMSAIASGYMLSALTPSASQEAIGQNTRTIDACSNEETWHQNCDTDGDRVNDAYCTTVTLPQWDSSIGVLQGVSVRPWLFLEHDLMAENISPLASDRCATQAVGIEGYLDLPAGPTATLDVDVGPNVICVPGPYDGTIDFDGPSGDVDFYGDDTQDTITYSMSPAPFVRGDVPVTAISETLSGSSSSDGNLIHGWDIRIRFCVRVTYTYLPQ